MKRALSLLAVSAWFLQGLLLLPLHEMQEAEGHDGCGACVAQAPEGPSAGPVHSHPVHDRHDCALCQSIQAPAEAAASAQGPGLRAAAAPVDRGPERRSASCSCRLPGSRAPPARTV